MGSNPIARSIFFNAVQIVATGEEGFKHLLKYVEAEGHSTPIVSYISPDGFTLGQWVSRQRQRYNKMVLEAYKIQRLEDLGGWGWNAENLKRR